MKLLKELTEAHGAPGFEDDIRKIVKRELKKVCNEVKNDHMGNVICFKKGTGKNRPKLMISAHMDEIGFLVKFIDDKGFIRVDPIGGFDPKTLIAKRVMVHGRKKRYIGVMGTKPVHIMTEAEKGKMPTLDDLFIDIGLTKKELEKDVEIGAMVTLVQEFVDHGKLVSTKALDDRVGVYVMIEAVKKAKNHQCDIYAVGSVQEEVGLRGATTAAYGIAPDIGLALDVTLACDVPGTSPQDHISQLGGGAAIKVKDSSVICNPKLVQMLQDLAKKNKIKYQMDVMPRGGTDTGAIQRSRQGVGSCGISIPTRYIHSVVETASKADIKACIDLLAKFIENCHKADCVLS